MGAGTVSHPASNVQLSLSPVEQMGDLSFQRLSIALTSADRLIAPKDLRSLTLPPGIDTTVGVVITGRGPIWLYTYLVHELHPTAWVACYDPRLGAVVVTTHSRRCRWGK
jgi:CRISPR-associated protein Csx3